MKRRIISVLSFTALFFGMSIFMTVFGVGGRSSVLRSVVHAASGQYSFSPSSGIFYVGRQFNIRSNITTDEGTTAADFIVDYDDTKLQIVDADAGNGGVQIFTGNLYPNYPVGANSVNGNRIILTGFTSNTSGVLQGGGTGWFGTIRALVVNTAPAGTDMTYEFTGVGNTTDSNISDINGIDMLDGITNGNYILLEDNTDPYFSDWQPGHGATNVSVGSDVYFRVNDDESGVDITSVTATIDGISYHYGDPGFSYSCTRSNYDVVPYCDVTINPTHDFPYDYDVHVNLYAEDLAANVGTPPIPDHNSATDSYTFHTEFDVNPPYTTNNIPARSSGSASTDTDISFDLRDDETGVEISSVSITVNGVVYTAGGPNAFAYTGNSTNYHIVINPVHEFEENELVFVQIDARDRATAWGAPAYNWLHENYWFKTRDTKTPWVDRRIPDVAAHTGIDTNDPITFHVNDLGIGVDISTLEIVVDGTRYTVGDTTYTGDSSDYLINLPVPANGWQYDHPVGIGINVCDFSHNCMTTDTYAFVRQSYTCPVCPVCEDCEKCDTPVEDKCESCDELVEKKCTGAKDTRSVDGATDYKVRKQIANKYVTEVRVTEFNDVRFDGWRKIIFARRIKLNGTATAGAMLRLRFDDDKYSFSVPVDQDGNWSIDLKNMFGHGDHKIVAGVVVDGVESEESELGWFHIVNLWWLLLLLSLGGVAVRYIYKRYFKYKDEKKKKRTKKA